MTLPSADESLLRHYLLGTVGPQSREDIEKRLFSDDRMLWERLCIVEDDLVTDYVVDALSADEKSDFEKHFLTTDERRAKVEFARALHAYVELQDASVETGQQVSYRPAQKSTWGWLRQPAVAWAVAAAAVLVLIVQGALAPSANRIPGNVNPPASAPMVVSVALAPGLTRGVVGELTRVRILPGTQAVRLQLNAPSETYPSYRATLHDVGGTELLSLAGLKPVSTADGPKILVTLPSESLPEGDYFIRLSSNTDSATLQRYDFRVLRD
jgi:hypothetical protein